MNLLPKTSPIEIRTAVLDWSLPLPEAVTKLSAHEAETNGQQRPLTILAADCVYYEPAFPDLLDTLERLLDGEGNGEKKCWFCVKRRRKADRRFIGALAKRFYTKEWDIDDDSGNKEKGVRLWEVRRTGWPEKKTDVPVG